jgi:transposase
MRDSASLGAVNHGFGHRVRLMPYVKPCMKRQKNDAADAEAICEAVTRPTTITIRTSSRV